MRNEVDLSHKKPVVDRLNEINTWSDQNKMRIQRQRMLQQLISAITSGQGIPGAMMSNQMALQRPSMSQNIQQQPLRV